MGLAACDGEGAGSNSHGAGSDGGEAGDVEPVRAQSGGGEGGEAGEAGAASAYAGLAGDQLTGLRLQHLKGFLMAAERVADAGHAVEAGILVQQGLLEVYDAAPDQFGGLNADLVRAAGAVDGVTAQQSSALIAAAAAEIDRAAANLNVDHAVLAARMVDIATGLYQGVVLEGFVDPVEYQHSMGAAYAARDALTRGENELKARDRRAYAASRRELDRFIALWSTPDAPETATPYAQVLAQGSRVRLALSPYL
jgi:hypothetical protein